MLPENAFCARRGRGCSYQGWVTDGGNRSIRHGAYPVGFTRFYAAKLAVLRGLQDDEKGSPMVRQLPWTHNLIILSQCKRQEEREFYLRLAVQEKWSSRELERQFKTALFGRTVLNSASASMRQAAFRRRREPRRCCGSGSAKVVNQITVNISLNSI